MPAVTTNLTIEQGTTWAHGWQVRYQGAPIGPTWTAAAQVRREQNTRSELLHTFDVEVTAAGVVILSLEPSDSQPWTFGTGYYDVEVTGPAGSPLLRVAQGRVTVSREVTGG